MTNEQLNNELKKNLAEIDTIQKQISIQAGKNPVNAMYERINYLTERCRETESLLVQMGDCKTVRADTQLDKAIAIAAGGAVSIRPALDRPEESAQNTGVNPINKITASVPQPQDQSTTK